MHLQWRTWHTSSGGQAAPSIHVSDWGGGQKLEKGAKKFAESRYLTFRAKRAAKMKIVYV